MVSSYRDPNFRYPETLGKLLFDHPPVYEFNIAKDLFIGSQHCVDVPREHEKQLVHYSPASRIPMGQLKRPHDEFIDWAEACGIKFVIRMIWMNGCNIYLDNPDDAAIIKLRWGNLV